MINFFSTNESWALLHWSVFSCLIYFFINNKYDVQKSQNALVLWNSLIQLFHIQVVQS
jgi:hypothetical protein